MDNINLVDHLLSCNSITIYVNGNTQTYDNESDTYNTILETLKNITKNSHEMPALGVSLDKETREALNKDMWLELNYNDTIEYLDMPFNKLTIKLEKDSYGINIIRHSNNKYEGRCYYLNLDVDTNKLYETILKTQ